MGKWVEWLKEKRPVWVQERAARKNWKKVEKVREKKEREAARKEDKEELEKAEKDLKWAVEKAEFVAEHAQEFMFSEKIWNDRQKEIQDAKERVKAARKKLALAKGKRVKEEQKRPPKIFSLAAGVDDAPAEYEVYRKYLDAAMEEPSIRNIAITGDYGIGKSSFLKWFAQGKHYLFVSLCDFNREENKKNVKETCCDIYRQLMIGCSRPRKKKEERKKLLFYGGAWVVVSLAVFYLLLNNTFGCMDWVMEIHREAGLKLYRLLHWHATDAEMALQKAAVEQKFVANDVIGNMKKWKFAADGFVGIAGFIVTVMILGGLRTLLSSLKLSFKTKIEETEVGAELELKKTDYSHYVDQLKVKLIDLLRREKKNYQSVIIFEDFDRFPYPVCRYLLNDLHDINRLLNYSIGTTEKNPIRFIYVLKDDLFAVDALENAAPAPGAAQSRQTGETQEGKVSEQGNEQAKASAPVLATTQMKKSARSADKNLQLKLFDYILPFVPGAYQMASAGYIENWLADAGVFEFIRPKFIALVGEYLFDYRTMRSIINEYRIIEEVYIKKREKLLDNGITIFDKKKILALAVYKTLMPEDYAGVRNGTSIFHCFHDDIPDDADIDPCVRALWDTEWLNAGCLRYVGLDAVAMKQYATKLVEDETEQMDDYPRLRNWIENTYHYWYQEFYSDRSLAEKIIKACPYSILCEGVKLSDRVYRHVDVVPFDRVEAIYENGNGNEQWNSTWQKEWQVHREKLEQLIPEKCKEGLALNVAVYISAFQNCDIFAEKLLQTVTPQWLVGVVSTDTYSRWLNLNETGISKYRFYANVAATYANAMEETEQNRLVGIIDPDAARALLSLPQNHSLPIPTNLETKIIKKFPDLAPVPTESSTSTSTSTSTPQAPSA
ncbi:MAG: hypothetical protein E7320_10270 [Clostridiales bacterium]|nr:hypothetical protein [Clostridiales bacterium]